MNPREHDTENGIRALSPLLIFLLLYLVTSLAAGDFYRVPITVAFLVSCMYAIATTPHLSLDQRLTVFSRGAGHPSLVFMLWIFLLAGAFAASAKQMGAIDATVNLSLWLLPDQLLMAGLFLSACFISLSIGTSVGTIVALTPIAAGIASKTDSSLPLMVAIVVGGAYFGDNLSFISDTTIIATRSQGCELKDKFKVNSLIVMPAAIITMILYGFMGSGIHSPHDLPPVDWIKVTPYLIVLLAAAKGINVLLVLTTGILLTGVIGMANDAYSLYGWFQSMGQGITGMGELIIITLLAGGLMEVIRHNGGVDFLIRLLTRNVKSKRGAELSIAALVCLTDLCTANNTVAIITVGPIVREISDRYGVDHRKSASILDTFSCMTQGLIPYGAQMLMAAGLASINPISIIPFLYYPMIMGICALLSILLRYPARYS